MIKGVIFDLSGTIIDKYSLSSLINLSHSCKRIDLYPNMLIKDVDKQIKSYLYYFNYISIQKSIFTYTW